MIRLPATNNKARSDAGFVRYRLRRINYLRPGFSKPAAVAVAGLPRRLPLRSTAGRIFVDPAVKIALSELTTFGRGFQIQHN